MKKVQEMTPEELYRLAKQKEEEAKAPNNGITEYEKWRDKMLIGLLAALVFGLYVSLWILWVKG